MTITPDDVVSFWFLPVTRERWFKRTPAFDATCRERFGAAVEAAIGGGFEDWRTTPLGALALCLLLDQLPRNLFRGKAKAFAGDERARAVAEAALADGFDLKLEPAERLFLYLPFEHGETLADQDRAVGLIATLDDPGWLDSARRHRDVIARFGRFPHRNEALGRPSTPEELRFVATPGSGF